MNLTQTKAQWQSSLLEVALCLTIKEGAYLYSPFNGLISFMICS